MLTKAATCLTFFILLKPFNNEELFVSLVMLLILKVKNLCKFLLSELLLNFDLNQSFTIHFLKFLVTSTEILLECDDALLFSMLD
jgi:hypothetical protein